MADVKISQLPAATTPVVGTEVLPIVQSGITSQVSINAATGITRPFTANGVVYASSSSVLATGSAFVFDGTNVGIGTSSPSEKLHVSGGNARINRVSNSSILTLGGSPSDNWEGEVQFVTSNTATNWRIASNRTTSGSFTITPSTAAGGSTFTTPAVTVDSSGNVGIATSSPTSKLTIGTGTFTAAASGTSGLYTTVAAGLVAIADGYVFSSRAGATYAQINSSGYLLLGQTSIGYVNADSLEVGGPSGRILYNHLTGTTSGTLYCGFAYNGSPIGSITQSGTTAVLYNLTSDQRLKENIQDAASSSALIDAIQVRQYNWKSDGSFQRYGFIAQELVTVAPEAVHQPEDTEAMMAVDYSKLVPMLVKEIQSLRKRLTALEQK